MVNDKQECWVRLEFSYCVNYPGQEKVFLQHIFPFRVRCLIIYGCYIIVIKFLLLLICSAHRRNQLVGVTLYRFIFIAILSK